MQGFTAATFFVNLALAGSLQNIWGMINSLQIVLHFPAINVNMPANVANFMNTMIGVTTIDVIPEEYHGLMYLWTYGTDEDPIQETFYKKDSNSTKRRLQGATSEMSAEQLKYRQRRIEAKDEQIRDHGNSKMNEVGYESVLLVENLGTLLAMIMMYTFLWIVLALFYVAYLCWPEWFNGIVTSLTKTLMWNVLLRFLLEGFFELSIIALIDWKYMYWDISNRHEKFSHIMNAIVATTLMLYPFVIYYILQSRTEEELQDEETKARIGSLTDGLKIKRRQGVLYNFIFVVRRCMLAATIVLLEEMPWL